MATCKSQLSAFIMWVVRIELKFSGLAVRASPLSHLVSPTNPVCTILICSYYMHEKRWPATTIACLYVPRGLVTNLLLLYRLGYGVSEMAFCQWRRHTALQMHHCSAQTDRNGLKTLIRNSNFHRKQLSTVLSPCLPPTCTR